MSDKFGKPTFASSASGDTAPVPMTQAELNAGLQCTLNLGHLQWLLKCLNTDIVGLCELIDESTCDAPTATAAQVNVATSHVKICIGGVNRKITFAQLRTLMLPDCPAGLTTPMLTCNPATGVASWIEAPEAGGSTGGGTLTDAQIHAAVCRARTASDNESGRVMYCTTLGLAQGPDVISLGGGGA